MTGTEAAAACDGLRVSVPPGPGSPLDPKTLQMRLDELAARYHVVAASLAVQQDDRLVEVAIGTANLRSALRATPATLFQIGSITKIYTATMVLQLAARGVLDIDASVARALPDLRLSQPELTEVITLRHLLSHTSGIDGDHFADVGRGDDAVERYVASCARLPQRFAPGATFAYSNAALAILGRAVEVALGTTWDRALAERLLEPLHCEASVTLPEQAILQSVAIGHLAGEGGDVGRPRPAPLWSLPRGLGPAGAVVATARDVLRLARLHLRAGRAEDGTQVLDPEQVRAMQEPQVELVDRMLGDHCGLGWFGADWPGGRTIGHDGATIGQSAYLRLVPDQDLAAVLLCSGGFSRALYEDLFSEVLAASAGVALRRTPAVPEAAVPADLDACTGTYERYGFRYTITAEGDGTLTLTPAVTVDEPLLALALLPQLRMVPLRDLTFVCSPPGMPEARATATFAAVQGGAATWLHVGGRAARRVAD